MKVIKKINKIICYYMKIDGWHRVARVVLDPSGICTTIHCQSNNLLQKVIVCE